MPRVLITRAPHQASPLADALRARGLEPVLIPTIELAPPTTFAPLDAAIAALTGRGSQPPFHWLLFTSANAVEAFATRLAHNAVTPSPAPHTVILSEAQRSEAKSKDPEGARPATALEPFSASAPYSLLPKPCRIAAIGPATARAITELLGTQPDLVPPQAIAESLAEALLPHAKQPDGTPTRFLLVRAESARDVLPETLSKAGGEVTLAAAYRTVVPQDSLPLLRTLFHSPEAYPDAIVFTSSSSVTNLMALLDAAGLSLPCNILRISIGPITSQTLSDLQLPPHAESVEPSTSALVDKIIGCVA
jgi:uroporphyrinogen-III synthase